MLNNIDLINIINTTLCLIILISGGAVFKKTKDKLVLSIAIAFGIFALSHIISLLGLTRPFLSFLITIRVLAYLIVAYALYKVLVRR